MLYLESEERARRLEELAADASVSAGSSRPLVAPSLEAEPNRGNLVPLPAGVSRSVPIGLRLDDGAWLVRAVLTDVDGAVDLTGSTGVTLLNVRTGIGRGVYRESLVVPARGLVFARAADFIVMDAEVVGLSKALSLFLGARKMTGPLVEYPSFGARVAAGANTVVVPPFAHRAQFIGAAGDTVQWRDGAAANVGPATALVAPGVLDVQVPREAFDAVFTTAGRGAVDWRVYG